MSLNAYEPWVHKVLFDHVQPDMVVWDVGAYVGYYVLLMHRLAPEGEILAFEPDQDNLRRLHKHLAINHVSNVTVIPMAVSAHGEDLPFMGVGAWSAATADSLTTVKSVTLDSMIAERRHPGLVLMDIEGGEAAALEGGNLLLEVVRPTWVVELHGMQGLSAYYRFVNAGYDVTAADMRQPIPAQLEEHKRVHILAVGRSG
jgi:FkbM family methyltransferase